MAAWMARFPPGKGGGEGVAYGRKGKGILIHSLTDGAGMPLSTRMMPSGCRQIRPFGSSVRGKSVTGRGVDVEVAFLRDGTAGRRRKPRRPDSDQSQGDRQSGSD